MAKEIYGYVSIDLQFYYTLILFFSKECLRKTVQKQIQGLSEKSFLRVSLNLVLRMVWVNVILGGIVYGVVMRYKPPGLERGGLTVACYVVAAVLEGMAEPFCVRALH